VDERVNPAEKLSLFSDRFAPRAVAEFKGNDIMATKLEGEFVGTPTISCATLNLYVPLKNQPKIRLHTRRIPPKARNSPRHGGSILV
jgi:hypothetical protein